MDFDPSTPPKKNNVFLLSKTLLLRHKKSIMKQIFFLLALVAGPFFIQAQPGDDEPRDTSWKKILRECHGYKRIC